MHWNVIFCVWSMDHRNAWNEWKMLLDAEITVFTWLYGVLILSIPSTSSCERKLPLLAGNRESSPTRQFTDTHFEDSSPTELKTVHQQNWRQFIDKFYIVFIWNVTIFTIYWCYNEWRPNIELIKLPICYCNMILLDIHTTAYIAIITLSVRKYILYH